MFPSYMTGAPGALGRLGTGFVVYNCRRGVCVCVCVLEPLGDRGVSSKGARDPGDASSVLQRVQMYMCVSCRFCVRQDERMPQAVMFLRFGVRASC